MLEVLFAMAILLTGLLGVAILIPVGKLAMVQTNKSDRTGACGRAALSEIKIRNMLNLDRNPIVGAATNVYVIDPLYYARRDVYMDNNKFYAGTDTTDFDVELGRVSGAGGLSRLTFNSVMLAKNDTDAATKKAQVDAVFRWRDDLIFNRPEDMTSTTLPSGGRPAAQMETVLGVNSVAYTGDFSWFLTVAPQGGTSKTYNVAVAVCWKRVFDPAAEVTCQGVTDPTSGTNPSVANGGGSLRLTYTKPLNVKPDTWIMLCKRDGSAANWYRVVHVGPSTPSGTDWAQTLSVVGPDWFLDPDPNDGDQDHSNLHKTDAVLLLGTSDAPCVTGVYTTTVRAE